MNSDLIKYLSYLRKSFFWLFFNSLFGLFPLILVSTAWFFSNDKILLHDLHSLIKDGTIMFVCITMVGAVYIDYYLSKHVVSNNLGRFAFFFFPLMLSFPVAVKFLVMHIKQENCSSIDNKLPAEGFELNSELSIIIITFTIMYSVFAKASLYLRDEIKKQEQS